MLVALQLLGMRARDKASKPIAASKSSTLLPDGLIGLPKEEEEGGERMFEKDDRVVAGDVSEPSGGIHVTLARSRAPSGS